jgi:hypothetical protein
MAEEKGRHSRKITERKKIGSDDVYVHFSEDAQDAFSWLYRTLENNHPTTSSRSFAANYADGCSDSLRDFLRALFKLSKEAREGSDGRAKAAMDAVELALIGEGGVTVDVRQRKRAPGE